MNIQGHLTEIQKAIVAALPKFKKLLKLKSVRRGAGKRNDLTSSTLEEVAAEVGVPYGTANKRLKLADDAAKA